MIVIVIAHPPRSYNSGREFRGHRRSSFALSRYFDYIGFYDSLRYRTSYDVRRCFIALTAGVRGRLTLLAYVYYNVIPAVALRALLPVINRLLCTDIDIPCYFETINVDDAS